MTPILFYGVPSGCSFGSIVALEWLDQREYDIILLDHDLRSEHYESDAPDDENTGYAIASWLAGHPESQAEAIIVIHSLNYYGALRMVDVLREGSRAAKHIPFDYLSSALNLLLKLRT